MSDNDTCRVCAGESFGMFSKTILGKHNVRYSRCAQCGHVQTERPYWLEEAYRDRSWKLDVGMADRCIWTAQTTAALARKLGIGPEELCLDWGAGTGLFVRLCRDYGMNFFYNDPFAQNIFASGFEVDLKQPKQWTLLTAFEVFEHLPDPEENFAEMAKQSPRYILFSTLLYQGQGADWWYFVPSGQHVAFYTRQSLEMLGKQHGYHLASNDCDLHLFSLEPMKDRILDRCRKSREAEAEKYKKKHGSRLLEDFEFVSRP